MNIDETHKRAMLAKQAVFKAQDALSLACTSWGSLTRLERSTLRKFEKKLARARAMLEALDRDYLSRRHFP